MKTFSRGQQVIVLLIIFGMTLIYFNSINKPSSFPPLHQGEGWGEGGVQPPANYWWAQPTLPYNQLSQPAADHRPPTTANLSGSKLLTLNKKINLNTATKTDLEAIRGIGPRRAEKIVEYRQRHGRFNRVEDLMNVKGIKEKGLEKVKRSLTVE